LWGEHDTNSVDIPAPPATARMPCFDDLADNVSITGCLGGNVTLHMR
jgi:hypothetical protein